MTIFRFSLGWIAAALATSGCGSGESPEDPRFAELQSRVDELERKLEENSAKDDRVFTVLKSEMVARRQKPSQPEKGAAMSEFLDGMEKSQTDRRLKELENREFLRSQAVDQ